ncbi:MAG TPA: NF038122 family metalloprotease [Pyrinomonadaceae bacterium]|nr:NF038122 family metalloprotease [Pyrinomonadaceae bacterium]
MFPHTPGRRKSAPRTTVRHAAARKLSLSRRSLIFIFTLLTAIGGPIALLIAQAQITSSEASGTTSDKHHEDVFVIYRNAAGESVCRVANAEEKRRLLQRENAGSTHTIYSGGRRAGFDNNKFNPPQMTMTGEALLPSAGLKIVLHATTQLQNNATARDAFIVAANRWEALVSTPITVVIDVDFGPTFFGEPFDDPNILGATGSSIQHSTPSAVRQQLISNAPEADELPLYNALPGMSIPVELNDTTANASTVRLTWADARALGLRSDITNPDSIPLGQGDAGIGFNSAHTFDFNPDDGISPGALDFDAVVVHEIGHALGFTSSSGNNVASPVSMWDLFRFRPGAASLSTFGTASRVMSEGGTQVFFNNRTNTFGSQELQLSTGGSDGVGGDGEQSSHWKDDRFTAFIGIMDPTLSSGEREVITDNDLKALDTFGYKIGGTAPPPPPPPPAPANDNFAAAILISGATGTASGTNVGATGEPGEPDHAGVTGTGRRSVWFNWTAPASSQINFNTSGSNYDTVLGIYTGSAVGSLTLIGANDDVQTGVITHSTVTFNAVAGTTYRIAVDGFEGDTGNFVLNWSGVQPTPTPTPTPQTFTISGRVVDVSGNSMQGVMIALDGSLANGLPHLPVGTDAGGNFMFTSLVAGNNYTVRSGDIRFLFTPASVTFNNLSANQFVSFTATRSRIDLHGRIVENGNGVPGVTVWLLHQATQTTSSTVTGSNGSYLFLGAFFNDGYEIIPIKDGLIFNPSSLIIAASISELVDITAAPGNPIDGSRFFVTQHYRDFLSREPDDAGLDFWSNGIETCGPFANCRQVKRVDTSAAFFLAIEFQETGYLVYRMYKAAFGDINPPAVPVPIRREEFVPDALQIRQGVQVGIGDWQQQLESNKNAFAAEFVTRSRFTNAFPTSMSSLEFVNRLNTNTGGALSSSERDMLVNALTNNTMTRAQVLRAVAEDQTLKDNELRKAFVLMQYFGYLRRNPNDAPDTNFNGYNFWLNKLNQFNGDFRQAEMVKAFILSIEYRQRFGQ